MKEDMVAVIHTFLKVEISLERINNAFLSLNQKKEQPTRITNCCPTRCINVTYKTISKALVTRHRSVLTSIISTSQLAFVKGSFIRESLLIANEIVTSVTRKGGEGFLAQSGLRESP